MPLPELCAIIEVELRRLRNNELLLVEAAKLCDAFCFIVLRIQVYIAKNLICRICYSIVQSDVLPTFQVSILQFIFSDVMIKLGMVMVVARLFMCRWD